MLNSKSLINDPAAQPRLINEHATQTQLLLCPGAQILPLYISAHVVKAWCSRRLLLRSMKT